jgi:hypothetical protein
MVWNFIDLTGNKYGNLTVVERVPNKNGRTYWRCKCECGNEREIRGENLKSGKTSSCYKCPVNTWEFKEDYVIGYTRKGERFFIDLEDYDRVSKYVWFIIYGYVTSETGGETIRLHRFVMKPKDDELVDHINHEKFDNRKSKLRVCTKQENNRNAKNTKGYYWNDKNRKYIAQITFNYENIYLGSYATEDEARLAYCTKALELFGEFVSEKVREDYNRLSKKLNESQINNT